MGKFALLQKQIMHKIQKKAHTISCPAMVVNNQLRNINMHNVKYITLKNKKGSIKKQVKYKAIVGRHSSLHIEVVAH